ncbi:hypothetical protein [Haloquadratum walsbyi]|uniref:hypothetical protein n=1 Tax=Haloquadratum walsbyi TaxID=293091 RepID=UPI00064EF434|nr:hypothetical protein [Haloquadratum walsbyi]
MTPRQLTRGGPISRDQLLGDYNPWEYNADTSPTSPWFREEQKPVGLKYAEASCDVRIQKEETLYEYFDDDSILADAPAYLAARLRDARGQSDPRDAVHKVGKNRKKWYQELIPGANLRQILKESSYGSLIEECIGPTPDANRLLEHNAFVGMVLVDDDTDPDVIAQEHDLDSVYILHESKLSHATTDEPVALADYGIELPAPTLVGEYDSGSQYTLIPWGDALTCSCPYKQTSSFRVMCKHELLASIVCGDRDSMFIPLTRGIDVPHRARRFVSSEIAVSHQPQTLEGNSSP